MAAPPKIDLKASLDAVRAGGLPERARRRLAEVGRASDTAATGTTGKLFTSDLSVSEFLLTREIGCTPISQVMGSSIYHIGRIADYKGATGEIESLSQAHREARRLALGRCRQEAQLVGADAVIGVHLAERLITAGAHGKGGDDGDEVIEFTVVGTAVHVPWLTTGRSQRPSQQGGVEPVMTDLSGQDLWALHDDGWEPCGLLFDFCRYHVWHLMNPDDFQTGGEIRSASDAVEQARQLVHARVVQQARACDAEVVVGSDIEVTMTEVPCGYEGCPLADCDIDVSWFATGIRRIPGARDHLTEVTVPELIRSMVPLGRRRRGEVVDDGVDDDEALREAAKEAEKEALERDGEGE